MKFLKRVGWIIAALIILFIVLAFVLPTEHQLIVEKKMDIPHIYAFNAINNVGSHDGWYPWKEEDENFKINVGDKSAGKGASYTWESDVLGNGKYTIVASDLEKGIQASILFDDGRSGSDLFELNPEGDGTKMSWTFDFKSGRFLNVFMPFMQWGIKRNMKKGIENIETLAKERKEDAKYFGYTINEGIGSLQYFSTIRSEVSDDKIQQFYASNLGKLFQAVQQAGIEMTGQPCGLIYNFKPTENKVDLASAIPVAESVDIPEAIEESLPAGPVVTLDFYGDYKDIHKGHKAIRSYLADREMVHNWPVIEEYITDPTTEQDPAKWLTKITYRVLK